MKLTPEVLMLIAKAREKMAMVDPLTRESFNDPVARTIIDEFHDLLDEALALCDLTDTTTIKELIKVLPFGFHRTELRVLLTTMTAEKEND